MDQFQTPIPPTNPIPPEANNPQNPPFAQPLQLEQNNHKQGVLHAAAFVSGILLSIVVLVAIVLLVNHISTHNTAGQLQPTPVGGAQCDTSYNYAQVAISGGADCTIAETVIKDASNAKGTDYKSNGYTCKATKEGSGTQWSSYWNDNFYKYSCSNGSKQVAFNWQPASALVDTPPETPATPIVTVGGPGALQPTPVGGTECNVSDNYAQVAISGGADCTTAGTVIQAANGSDYNAAGYTCKATKEGSNTQWSDYWDNDFYAYTCANGSKQVAFNWQSPSSSTSQ